jgi:pimeloyl-ACP methyl ester carboxylesterase
VLAVHGLTTNRRMWRWLADHAPDLDLVCPDLRGRGGSPPPTGTSSLERHADDLRQVLDVCGLGKVHVVGMSFGASVAVVLAALHPDRVSGLTLLDGGLPLPPPAPVAAYAAAYAQQTGGALDAHDPTLLECLAGDLLLGARGGRPVLDVPTAVDDAADLAGGAGERVADRVLAPAALLYAQWRTAPGTAPFYSHTYVAQARARWPWLERAIAVPGADHVSMGLTAAAAARTSELIPSN